MTPSPDPLQRQPKAWLKYAGILYTAVESTTVKVSKDTARKLAVLQRRLGKGTLDETIQTLVARHRQELIDAAFGADRGKLRAFSEGDRGESRS